MKHYRSILSVVFAVLVLFSSSSFIVGIHLCAGHVQDIALLTPAEDCGMDATIPVCHKPGSKPCCQNEAIIHDGDDFKASVNGVTLPQINAIDLELPHVLLTEIIPSLDLTTSQFYNYDPPLRQADLTVSLQVFLI
jgi:hypothetical protein